MLKKLGFKNYRSFIKRTDLEFAPLTILVGPNSTGKSSIMRLIRWLFSRPDELIWNWNADGQDLTPGDPTPLEISVDYSVIEQLYPEIIQPNFHFATKLIFDWHNNEPVMPIFTDYSFFCDEPSIDMQVDLIVGSPEYAAGNLFKWPINIERSFQSIRWENLFRRNHEEVRQLFTEIFNVFYGFKNGDYFDPILYPKNYRSGIPGINILKSAIHEPEWLPEFFSEAISPGEDELDLFENLWDIVKETGVELVPFLQQKGGEEWKDFAKSKDPGDNLKKILPNNAYRETDYPFEEINWEDDDIANFFLEMIGQLNGLREIEEKLGSPLEAKLYFRLANRWAILTFFDKLRRRLARLRLSAIASVSRAHEQNLAVKFYAAHREELTRDLALSFKNDMIRKVREIQRGKDITWMSPEGDPVKSLQEWIDLFDLKYDLIYEEIPAKSGRTVIDFGLKDKRTGKTLDFANVGYGLGQIFPILIDFASYHYPRSKIYLIEQPESQLHPALQSKLADFFVANLDVSRQIILETHSEYLIRKLQVLIAGGKLKPGDVAILYVNQDERGISQVQKMRLGDKGAFLDPWPPGFFDESTDLAIEFWEAGGHKN